MSFEHLELINEEYKRNLNRDEAYESITELYQNDKLDTNVALTVFHKDLHRHIYYLDWAERYHQFKNAFSNSNVFSSFCMVYQTATFKGAEDKYEANLIKNVMEEIVGDDFEKLENEAFRIYEAFLNKTLNTENKEKMKAHYENNAKGSPYEKEILSLLSKY